MEKLDFGVILLGYVCDWSHSPLKKYLPGLGSVIEALLLIVRSLT